MTRQSLITGAAALPVLSPEGGLNRYLAEIRSFPLLSAANENMLAKRWVATGDRAAAQQLVTSHLRLVAKVAFGYRGYGLPIGDLISEGNVGLMQAVKKFDPERGFRLSTYALWWIKAAIQEYILHSWSLVKMGTTAAQKKLFFNLRKVKAQMRQLDDKDLSPEAVAEIADRLNVGAHEVISMNGRLSAHDASLNAPVGFDSDDSWQDLLVDEALGFETQIMAQQESKQRNGLLSHGLGLLKPREREILEARRLKDDPDTLEELAQKYNISRERVRQIEARAFEKLESAVKAQVAA